MPEPEFALSDGFIVSIRRGAGEVTGEVAGEVMRLLRVMKGSMKRSELQEALQLRHEEYFREAYLVPAMTDGFIEMTIPNKPRSSNQKYRMTEKGKTVLANINPEDSTP